jgi:hypothetical protein
MNNPFKGGSQGDVSSGHDEILIDILVDEYDYVHNAFRM